MAVWVELALPGATREAVYEAEAVAMRRGQAAGRPPYAGLMFFAIVPDGDDGGVRLVSTWRTEDEMRVVVEEMLRPDLRQAGVDIGEVTVLPVWSMAIPGSQPG